MEFSWSVAMKRMLKIAVLYALLGTVASMAIAIIASAWDEEMMTDPPLTASLRRQAWEAAEARGQADVEQWVERSFSDSLGEVIVISGIRDESGSPIQLYSVRFGWPIRSMGALVSVNKKSKPWQTEVSGGFRLRKPLTLSFQIIPTAPKTPFQEIDRVLTFTPLWPGFALNGMVLGLGLWLAVFASRVPVRMLRVLRGRCSACGYLVRSSPICTECGRKLRRRRKVALAGEAKLSA